MCLWLIEYSPASLCIMSVSSPDPQCPPGSSVWWGGVLAGGAWSYYTATWGLGPWWDLHLSAGQHRPSDSPWPQGSGLQSWGSLAGVIPLKYKGGNPGYIFLLLKIFSDVSKVKEICLCEMKCKFNYSCREKGKKMFPLNISFLKLFKQL